MVWGGTLGTKVSINGTFNKLISLTSLYKLTRLNSIYNPLSCRLLSSLSSSSSTPLLLSSSASDKDYQHFFPSFYDGYVSRRIQWYYSLDPPHPLSRYKVDKELENVFNKDRMDFPHLGKQVHYEYDFDQTIRIYARKGDHCDVISLLSTHGDQLVRIGATDNNTVKAENLRGKYILICCTSIPLLWMDDQAIHLRKLSLLGSEMSQTGCDFEIVIVANMRSPEWDDEGVFNHFFTAFSGCLVVPFHHKYRREYICRSLRLEWKPTSILLVDPSQKVMEFYDLAYIVRYGVHGFPFTTNHRMSLSNQDQWGAPCAPDPPSCNTTLPRLLSCESDPTSFLLQKLNSEETISVEQLNKHHVGFYLFNQGDQLKQIHHIYQV